MEERRRQKLGVGRFSSSLTSDMDDTKDQKLTVEESVLVVFDAADI